MKSFVYFLLTLTLLVAPRLLLGQEYYFKLTEESKERINTIVTKAVSIDKVEGSTVYAYANPKELEKIKSLGYQLEMLAHPSTLAKSLTMATTIAQMASWDRYPTYEVYRGMMKKWEQDYPTLCKLDSIGEGAGTYTVIIGGVPVQKKRQLYVIKISDNVLVDEAEPEFFYTSTMHGDEATGFYMLLRLIDYMLANYSTDPRVAAMVNSMAIYINPNANPDGTYYGGNSTVSGARRSNANGVDINRNFPDPRDGDHPDGNSWQPETVAMMNYATSRHFVLSANFHGGIELANYPWDTWTSSQNPHADNNWWYTVARQYADLAQANSPAGYFTGMNNGVTHGADWYVVEGGRQDYFNYWHHCREITLEVSDTKLIASENLIAHWNYNREAMLTYMELIFKGFYGTVTNTSGQPLNATITIVGHDKDNSHVVTNPAHGNYYRMIAPGTYRVKFSASGYISQIHDVTIANYTSSIIKNVVLVASSQTSLTGLITDSESGNPVQGVKVDLVGSSVTPVYTAANGIYTFTSINEDIYQIRATKSGYVSATQEEVVTLGNNDINFSLTASNAESFESNIPAGFTFTGGNWTRDNSVSYDGNYSMKSAAISHSAQTSMQITLNIATAGSISFYRKVSSESGYDFLRFYIDGVKKGEWSGAQDWAEVSYTVTTGSRVFKWEYSKDGNASTGSDCAWVDNIIFPQSYQNVTFTVTSNSIAESGALISFNSTQQTTNASGVATFTNVLRGNGKAYSVSKTGFDSANGELDVLYTNVNKAVSLTSGAVTYTLTFNVKYNSEPISGALVTLNGNQKTTLADGSTTFSGLPQGSYNYSVVAEGYNAVNGNIGVSSNQSVNVNMVLSSVSTPVISGSVFELNTWPLPFTSHLNVALNVVVPSKVIVEIYSITGQKVLTLSDKFENSGVKTYTWNVSENIPSGVYFVKVTVNGNLAVKKVLYNGTF
jgi:hypothetical protein